jgi:TolB-like protein/Tfp pilus assembly protein PilF
MTGREDEKGNQKFAAADDSGSARLARLRALRRALGHDVEASEQRFLALVHRQSPKVIAVLPFRTEGPEETADASLLLDDPLIARLGVVPQIIVRPASASGRFRQVSLDFVAAGRELEADYVLGGSIRRVGGRVRATAHFVNVRDSTTLWETEFEEQLRDMLSLEDSITTHVIERLNLSLSADEWQRTLKRHTEIPEAYEKYKLGRLHWNKLTEEALQMAIAYFKQAIELDPGYAKAYAGIADCYTWMGIYNLYRPQETFGTAKRWAERAIELDDTLAEAYTSLAFTRLCYDWDWAAARSSFQRAIKLDPNYATAHQGYAHLLTVLGRFDEALEEIEKALRIDPRSLIVNVVKGVILYEARRYESSLEQFLKTIELDNKFDATYYGLALVYGERGQYHDASVSARKAYHLSLYEPVKKTVMAYIHAMSNEMARAAQELRELNELRVARESYVSPFHMALIYAALDEIDQAFECLEEAFKDRDQWLVFLKVEPRLDVLRRYRRFHDMLLRLNFG